MEGVLQERKMQTFFSVITPSQWIQYGVCVYTVYQHMCIIYSNDPGRVYDTQPSVTVFQSAWVNDVIVKRCTIHDLPLGHYLVLPHYLVQVHTLYH